MAAAFPGTDVGHGADGCPTPFAGMPKRASRRMTTRTGGCLRSSMTETEVSTRTDGWMTWSLPSPFRTPNLARGKATPSLTRTTSRARNMATSSPAHTPSRAQTHNNKIGLLDKRSRKRTVMVMIQMTLHYWEKANRTQISGGHKHAPARTILDTKLWRVIKCTRHCW